jgi:hypothetical protein
MNTVFGLSWKQDGLLTRIFLLPNNNVDIAFNGKNVQQNLLQKQKVQCMRAQHHYGVIWMSPWDCISSLCSY